MKNHTSVPLSANVALSSQAAPTNNPPISSLLCHRNTLHCVMLRLCRCVFMCEHVGTRVHEASHIMHSFRLYGRYIGLPAVVPETEENYPSRDRTGP